MFRPVTVLGQELMFTNPTGVQASILMRLSKVMDAAYRVSQDEATPKARQDQAAGQVLESMGKVLDLFGSLLAEGDEAWLAQQMLTGKVSDEALLKMLQDLIAEDEDVPAQPEPKAKANPQRVRRA